MHGVGSPTLILEGGDGYTSDSYAFAESALASETRTCVYDRANLGLSDPAPGPRGLDELVGDLESLMEEAGVEPPYVLVGTSGGGFITASYAVRHLDDVAGMVFVDTGVPFRNPPAPVVAETTWDHPSNVEQRDYLQVEKDAWNSRVEIGDIPVSVVSVEYSPAGIEGSPFASERAGMRENIQAQQGWLSPQPTGRADRGAGRARGRGGRSAVRDRRDPRRRSSGTAADLTRSEGARREGRDGSSSRDDPSAGVQRRAGAPSRRFAFPSLCPGHPRVLRDTEQPFTRHTTQRASPWRLNSVNGREKPRTVRRAAPAFGYVP